MATYIVIASLQSKGRPGVKVKEAHNGVKLDESKLQEATWVEVTNTTGTGSTGANEAVTAVRQLLPGLVTTSLQAMEVTGSTTYPYEPMFQLG